MDNCTYSAFSYWICGKKHEQKKAMATDKEDLKSSGINPDNFISLGTYLGGLSNLPKSYKRAKLLPTNEGFDLYAAFEDEFAKEGWKYDTKKIGQILNSEVKNVITEDKSTSEKRMSIGNVVLFGPLGLAMQKTKKQDMAFLIFKLSDGSFDTEAIFCLQTILNASTGNCFAIANEAKAKIISHLTSLSSK